MDIRYRMKIAVIREGKVPPDKRVPLTPKQCSQLQAQFPELEIIVQCSSIRAFTDDQYRAEGVVVQENISDCDVLVGVKEVPKADLLPNKTYFYFSHTIKMQPYNRDLLRRMLELNIRMIDYEVITAPSKRRLIGFGRYAGIVGCYNGFLAYGKKVKRYELKPANQCADRVEMEEEMRKVNLPANFKVVLTGLGRVGGGAIEIVEKLGLKKVDPKTFLTETFEEPVYTQLSVVDYNQRKDGKSFERSDFYREPVGYESTFLRYAKVADVYVACHYWDSRSPFIFTREDVRAADWNVKVVADISCDIDGPVASTIRPSTIAEPLYGYDPATEQEGDFFADHTVGVMAVDNLPCELPKDASEDFGNEFMKSVLPCLLNDDPEKVIERATMCENGALTKHFLYLQDYVDGKE